MVEAGDGAGICFFCDFDAEFFGGAATVNRGVGTGKITFASKDFSGFWVGGEALVVDDVGEMLGVDESGFWVDVDQEIAIGVEINKPI